MHRTLILQSPLTTRMIRKAADNFFSCLSNGVTQFKTTFLYPFGRGKPVSLIQTLKTNVVSIPAPVRRPPPDSRSVHGVIRYFYCFLLLWSCPRDYVHDTWRHWMRLIAPDALQAINKIKAPLDFNVRKLRIVDSRSINFVLLWCEITVSVAFFCVIGKLICIYSYL